MKKTRPMDPDYSLIWLGLGFLKITFSQQEDDPLVDIEEIRELLDEESSNE